MPSEQRWLGGSEIRKINMAAKYIRTGASRKDRSRRAPRRNRSGLDDVGPAK